MDIGSDDRVLAFVPVAQLAEVASRAALVVGMVEAGAVADARAALRDHANAMIVPSDPDGAIPWKDEFFSVVYAPSVTEPSAEMLRVLMPGGRSVVAGGVVTKARR